MKHNTFVLAAVVLPLSTAHAGNVILDYNDMAAGDMKAAANANTGIGFAEANWNTGTGTQIVVADDLTVSTPGYSDPGGGTPQKQSTNNAVSRQQERQIVPLGSAGPIWFSFLATKPSGPGRVGFGVNRDATGGSSDPRVLWLNDEVQFRQGGASVGNTSLPASTNTYLFIGRITPNESGANDRVEIWVDPADVTDEATLTAGVPDIDYSATNWLNDNQGDGDTISRLNPTCYGATGADAPTMDNLRLSDDPVNGFSVVTTGVLPTADPVLEQDTVNGSANLAFGMLYFSGGAAAETPVRTVRFNNEGPTEDIEIRSATIDDANGVFTITDIAVNGAGGLTLPQVLTVGDYIEISVKGQAGETGKNLAYNATLTIDTDEDTPDPQDQSLPISATFIGEGDRLNDNHLFEDGGGTANGWAPLHARITPGLAPGSGHMVRVVGEGDPSGDTVGAANQASGIPGGITDFESVFYFSPIAPGVFKDYVDDEFSPDGSLTDRTMNYLLLSDDNDQRNGDTIEPGEEDNIIVNLAYMPDGVPDGGGGSTGLAGFYVFNGTSGSWELAIAVDLAGSTDIDTDGDPLNGIGDGVLDAGSGDTVHSYLVTVKGVGFGAPGASYAVSVSSPTDAAVSGILSSGALSAWHGVSGESATVDAHAFTTADRSDSNPEAAGFPPFWVDEAALYFGSIPAKLLTVIDGPDNIVVNGDTDTAGTTEVVVRNDGAEAVSITGLSLPDSSWSVVPAPSLPISVDPGAIEAIVIRWDSTATVPPAANVSWGPIVIENDGVDGDLTYPVVKGTVYSSANLLPNWNFEVPGTDPDGDTNTFSDWVEDTNVVDFGGLVAGSATSANTIASGAELGNTVGAPAENFLITFPFALFPSGSGSGRIFNMHLRDDSGGDEEVNLRIAGGGEVEVYGGTGWIQIGTAIAPEFSEDGNSDGDLDDPEDTKNVYTFEVGGTGWGTNPTLSVKLIGPDGSTVLVDESGLTEAADDVFRVEPASPFDRVAFRSNNDTPRYAVDDVSITVVIPVGIEITGISGGPGGFTIEWTSSGPVDVERFNEGTELFDVISPADADGTHTDSTAPGRALYRLSLP